MPSSSVGISIKLHPYALNALIAARYVGLSQSTISPSSKKTFPDKFKTPNKFISNNIVSNKLITYLCTEITVENYGK